MPNSSITPAVPPEAGSSIKATTPPDRSDRVGYLDGLRASAALIVLFHHAYLTVWPIYTSPSTVLPHGLTLKLTFWLLYAGPLAVDLFIVLSGYCLLLPVIRREPALLPLAGGARRFYIRRAWRILPTYYAALALSILLDLTILSHPSGTHWDCSLPVTRDAVVEHLLLIHPFYGSSSAINHPMWSVAVEWWIYFLFPPLVALWRRFGALTATLLGVVGGIGLQVLLVHLGIAGAHAHFIALFALGMLAAGIVHAPAGTYTQKLRDSVPWPAAWAVATICLLGLFYRLGFGRFLAELLPIDILWGMWSILLLVSLAKNPRFCRLPAWSPLVWIGGFSYSLYLMHAPILQIYWELAIAGRHHHPLGAFLLLISGAPLVVGAAWIFYVLAERPVIQRLSARRSQPGRSAPTA